MTGRIMISSASVGKNPQKFSTKSEFFSGLFCLGFFFLSEVQKPYFKFKIS